MAIFSAVPPPPELGGAVSSHHAHENENAHQQGHHEGGATASQQSPLPTNANGIDVEAWTVSALESLSVSAVARGTGTPLSIPLDGAEIAAKKEKKTDNERPAVSFYDQRARSSAITPPPRPPSRRDSLKRREALLKGNEGSRQRRRWENDRLLHVPNAVPPEPQDFVPQPTYPVQHVPYRLAAAWELRVRAEVEARSAALARRKQAFTRTLGDDDVSGRVPRELCQRAKKTPAVRAWVRSLEEPVRRYLVERDLALATDDSDSSHTSSSSELDSEDEEIVFVGRNGSMRDGKRKEGNDRSKPLRDPRALANAAGQWKKARREEKKTGETQDEGMLFDALGDEDGGAFRRWITHSISEYYGLQSRSVLVGNPKRKVVYVGIKQMKTGHVPPVRADLPRPLWELC
ncbi:R3H-associated N-terminal domain-containing protein [Nemania sp. FL0916]|nr:R3H-associated N-terminal domain-containing protein [Nemania sp. FL0916]